MNLLNILTSVFTKKAPDSGAFSFPSVNKFGARKRRPGELRKKHFNHSKHIRAELPLLREKAKQPLFKLTNEELLETQFLIELDAFRRVDIPRHKLLWRWVRRHDPGLHKYLSEIAENRQWYDIMQRMRDEYQKKEAFGYQWPEKCEPIFHSAMSDAMISMRALGKALIEAESNNSFDLEKKPFLTAEAEKGGAGEGESGGGSAKTPKTKKVDEEEEENRVFFVPVEEIMKAEGPKPPWVK